MKIGIITLYHNYNYGAVLQAYALQSVIKRHWPDCDTINYYREINGIANKPRPVFVRSATNIFRSMISNKTIDIISYIRYQKRLSDRNELFDDFIHRNISESKNVYYGHKNLNELNNYYDVFVAGSDNIWNKNLLDSAFFLDFADDDKGKLSYAAGMSYDSADDNVIGFIKPLLLRLDYISTREPTGKMLIESITEREVFQAVDPTLLLSADEWRTKEHPIDIHCNNGYILCFFIEPTEMMFQEARLLKKETGKDIVCLPLLHQKIMPQELEYADFTLFNIGPEELIYIIRNADFICTDSFHGTVFSIIFNKQFACFRRFQDANRSSLNLRMDHLFDKLNLPNRIDKSIGDIQRLYTNGIDYDPVNVCIEKLRNESIQFLYDSIMSIKIV